GRDRSPPRDRTRSAFDPPAGGTGKGRASGRGGVAARRRSRSLGARASAFGRRGTRRSPSCDGLRPSGPRSSPPLDAEVAEEAVEGASGDARAASGLGDVAARGVEEPLEVLAAPAPLRGPKVLELGARLDERRLAEAERLREVLEPELAALREGERARERVPQLADVPAPP